MRFQLPRRYKILGGVLLLVGVVIGASLMLSAPQHGTPARSGTLPAKKHQTVTVKTSPPSSDEQQYFKLELPAGYNPQPATQPGGTILFSQTIIKPSAFGSVLINIGLRLLPEGGITSDPSYNLRITDTSRYKISQHSYDGELVMIASDAQSASVVAFWVHGGYEATISASQGIGNPASDDNAAVAAILTKLLNGWTWK